MRFASIRAVLFDAGNTLVHLDYEFIAGVLAGHGHPCDATTLRHAEYAAKAATDRAFLDAEAGTDGQRQGSYFDAALAALGVAPGTRPAVIAALGAEHRRRCLWRVIERDTAAVLETLRRRGFLLGVVSNADGRIEADLLEAGLGTYLATVVDSHVVGIEKPDPAVFRLALARLGMAPEASLYVGDLYSIDVLGARRAGLEAVLLDPLGRYPGAVDCERIAGLRELLDLLPEGPCAP
jgi:putative hydrolase of the HAD superfamily